MGRLRTLVIRLSLAIAAAAWAIFSFWLFSFSFSDSFFQYNLPSRLPPFLAAVFSALVIPVSGARQWLRVRQAATTRLRAWLAHAVATGVSLLPFVLAAAFLAKAPAPWKLSADDAMGLGIDFLMLLGMALISLLVVAVMLAITRPASALEEPPPNPSLRRCVETVTTNGAKQS
jgi:hypothetical protein